MIGPFVLVSYPPATIPFMLKRRELPGWVRDEMESLAQTMPEEIQLTINLAEIEQKLDTTFGFLRNEKLKTWLIEDISACVSWLSSVSNTTGFNIKLEVITERMCPKFHVDRVPMRLLCTYVGPGTEWTDANTAYSVNFEEPFDPENISQVPSEGILIFSGAHGVNSLAPLWHRSPDVLPNQKRLLLCIDVAEQIYPAQDNFRS